MNLPRYKFSKECDAELAEFFKAVGKLKEPAIAAASDSINLWKALLPVNKEIQQKISSCIYTTATDEIIEIIESDEEKIETETSVTESLPLLNQTLTQLSKVDSDINTVEDMIDGIQELLQTEAALNETIISHMGNNFSKEKLQDMFASLAKILNSECALKMWRSVMMTGHVERNTIVPFFAEYILVEKITHEQNNFIKIMFMEMTDEFPNEIVAALKKILFETKCDIDLAVFKSNLCTLSDDQKNVLLSIFRNDCQKLELHHLSIIQTLLTPSSNVETLIKITDLMCQTAKEFASDKGFGKLLLEIIQSLGPNIVRGEQHLKYIILNHKSVFKAKIARLFDSCIQDHKVFSQSFSM